MRRANLVLCLASLSLCLVLAEAGLQAAYRIRHGRWLAEDRRTFYVGCIAPVADRREYSLRPGYADALIRVDEDGFRLPRPRPAAHLICALGDSVPFGADVADDQSYPAQLDRLLAQSAPQWTVLNAGTPSYNLRQSFDRLRIDVLPRRRPGVVLVDAFNDVSLLAHYRERWNPDRTWADKRWRLSMRLGTLGRAIGLAGNTLASVYYLSEAAKGIISGSVDFAAYPADPMLAHVRALLDRELPELAGQGTKAVLVAANPFFYQTGGEAKNPDLALWPRYARDHQALAGLTRAYNQVLAEAASRHAGTYFFDARPVFDQAGRQDMYLDFIHYSPQGNRLMAEALKAFLLDHQLAP